MSNYLRGKAYGFIEELIKEIAIKKAEVNLTGSNLEGNREVAEQVAELDIKKLKARNHVTKGFIEAVQKRITGDEELMMELMDLYVTLSEKPDPKPNNDFEFILEDDDATFNSNHWKEVYHPDEEFKEEELIEIKGTVDKEGRVPVSIGGETCWISREDYDSNPEKYTLVLVEKEFN